MAEQKLAKQKKKEEKIREKQLIAQQLREERENLRRQRQEIETSRALMQRYSADSEDIEVDIDENESLLDVTEDDDEELDYDDELSFSSSSLPLGEVELNAGYAALSGSCGTYAVREPEGLVVLPLDPNRNRPKYNGTKDHGDEKKTGSQHSSTTFSSIFNKIYKDNADGSANRFKEPFTISEGQKVQVVGVMKSNDQGVYQLARGGGFVVASANQLVKGMLCYVTLESGRFDGTSSFVFSIAFRYLIF